MKKLVFHKVRDTECDFCGRHQLVVTSVNETTYVCDKCAKEISAHTRLNENAVGSTLRNDRLGESYCGEWEAKDADNAK